MENCNSNTNVTDTQPTSSDHSDEQFNDKQYEWQSRKISPEDLEEFCVQLENLVKYVRGVQELAYLTCDRPR